MAINKSLCGCKTILISSILIFCSLLLSIVLLKHKPYIPDELHGQIAFVSSPDRNGENIILFDVNNQVLRPLTNTSQFINRSPAWSPDGSRIVFSSNRDGGLEIYVINVDGSELQRLTNNSVADKSPFWSPDGQWIGFTSDDDLYIMRPDGTEQTLLIQEDDGRVWAGDWSPDGKKIVYQSDVEGHFEIYVANVDGSGKTRLTHTDWMIENRSAQWSPDGTKIAFVRDGPQAGIFIMDATGGNEKFLVEGGGCDWSSDGKWIVFGKSEGADDKIYLIKSNGESITKLIDLKGYNAAPVWFP